MVGKCRLCNEEKELCKQSHIIPNFMYREFFDDKNRIKVIKSNSGRIKQQGYRQTGEYDRYVLCATCDNERLGRLDRYASLILYDGFPNVMENRTSPKGTSYTYCPEIDYVQFKLFLLSLLFRASISDRPLFREIHLGPHEEQIRQMLFSGNQGEKLEYPCLMMTYLQLKQYPREVIAQPARSIVSGGHVYTFMIGGMIYLYFTCQELIPPESNEYFLSAEGEMKIIHLTPRITEMALGHMLGIKLQ